MTFSIKFHFISFVHLSFSFDFSNSKGQRVFPISYTLLEKQHFYMQSPCNLYLCSHQTPPASRAFTFSSGSEVGWQSQPTPSLRYQRILVVCRNLNFCWRAQRCLPGFQIDAVMKFHKMHPAGPWGNCVPSFESPYCPLSDLAGQATQ